MGNSAEPSDRELEVLVLRVVAGVIAVILAAGLVQVTAGAGSAPSGDDPPPGLQPAQAIGPLPGEPVPAYVARRRADLDAAAGTRAAVVSFRRYLTLADAAAALGRLDARAWLVAPPGGPPAPTADLAAWAAQVREQAAAESAELGRLRETTDDAEFQAQYEADRERLRAVADRVQPDGEVVFGAVVVATAERLRRLAAEPAVRLVDVGAGERPPPLDQVAGLRPEEAARVADPPFRPLP